MILSACHCYMPSASPSIASFVLNNGCFGAVPLCCLCKLDSILYHVIRSLIKALRWNIFALWSFVLHIFRYFFPPCLPLGSFSASVCFLFVFSFSFCLILGPTTKLLKLFLSVFSHQDVSQSVWVVPLRTTVSAELLIFNLSVWIRDPHSLFTSLGCYWLCLETW